MEKGGKRKQKKGEKIVDWIVLVFVFVTMQEIDKVGRT